MDFHKIWYWGLLCKSVEKIQIFLKTDVNIGHFISNCKKAPLLPPTLNRHRGVLFCWNGIWLWQLPPDCPFVYLCACPHDFMSMRSHASCVKYRHLGNPRRYKCNSSAKILRYRYIASLVDLTREFETRTKFNANCVCDDYLTPKFS